MNIAFSFWKNASPKRKRIYSLIAIFIVSILVTLVGSFVPLSTQDAETIYNQVNQTITENKDVGSLTQYIFINNFSICLVMFIPFVGLVFGMFTLFSTGIALGAIASVQGYPIILEFFLMFVTPIFWLEFISYALAMTASIWLLRRVMQRRWKELKWTGIAIALTALLLGVGAVVEAWLIVVAA